jgi:hypothetical protein
MNDLPTDADRQWLYRELDRALEDGHRAARPEPERTAYERAEPWLNLAARAFAALGRGLAEFGRFLTRLEAPAQILMCMLIMFVTAFALARCS